MRVNQDLCMLPVSMEFHGRTMVMNLSLILDDEHGHILVDAAMPNNEKQIETAIAAEGFPLASIKHILVTHQDIDHIGSLFAIQQATGATVYAHRIEVPYIEGKLRSVKYPSPERLKANPGFKEMLDGLVRCPVDKMLEDGDILDFAGGIRAILTPGHTPGHTSFFLERSKALILGDAMTSENGTLNSFNPDATPDHGEATESIRKLADLPEVTAIIAYHGGLVDDDPLGQLKRIAAG